MHIVFRIVTVLASAMLCSVAARAQQQPTALPLQLTWHAPPGCGESDEIIERTARILGSWRPAEPLEAEATVGGTPGQHLVLQLAIGRGGDRRIRRIEATTCEELSRASSVVLALAVNPELTPSEALAKFDADASAAPEGNTAPDDGSTAKPDEVAGTPAPSGTAVATVYPPSRSPGARVIPGRRPAIAARAQPGTPDHTTARAQGLARTRAAIGIGPDAVLGVLGVMGSPVVGMYGQLGLDLKPITFRVHGNYLPSRKISLDSQARAGFSLRAMGVRGCWFVSVGKRLGLGGCLGADLGKIRGKGEGIAGGRRETRDWSALGAGPRLTWELWRPLSLEAGADALLALQRPRFYLNDELLMQPAQVALASFVAISTHFP